MPALGTVYPTTISYRDATSEIGTMRLYNESLAVGTIAGYATELAALLTATDNITLGVRAGQSWGGSVVNSNDKPSDQSAQRESKLLVQYRDTVTEKPYTLTVPTIDYSTLVFLEGGGDAVAFLEANGASAEIQAWVDAFESIARAPDNVANAVEVTGMRYVGRNS